jgi:hypothetical protein
MTKRHTNTVIGATHNVLSKDGTMISYLSIGGGPSVLVLPGVLLMYGGKSDSKAVNLAMERLAAILPHSETKEFPKLDHFGIERTAPREVAKAVTNYFLK